MEARGLASMIRDGLVTILAVWAILILTGMAFARWQPALPAAILSFTVCTGLLFAWARWAGPGHRTPLPVFMLAGFLYILLTVTLALSLPTAATDATLWVAAGFSIGFQPGHNGHPSVETFIVPMLLNLFGPIVTMGLLRGIVRGDWRR